MAEGATIGFHRYEGQSLQTMYSWMHEQGSGPSSAETARAALVGLGTLLSDVESQIRTALKDIGIEWEGAAAAAAGQTIRQAATWVSDAGQVSMTSCRPAADQGEVFTATRAQIQQPQSAEYGFGDAMADGFNAVTDVAIGPLNPFDIQTDVDQAAKQNAAHHAAAVQAMYTWNSAAQTNLAAMPPVQATQPIAVDAAPASGAHQPAVGYGGSAPAGPAGGGGYSGTPSTVAAQHVTSALAGTPGPGVGAGPVSSAPAVSGGSPPPFLPAAPAPTPAQGTGPGAPRAGGPVAGPGTAAVPGAGTGIGPGGSTASGRPRGRFGVGGAPAGRGIGGLGQEDVARLGPAGIARSGLRPGAAAAGDAAEAAARPGSGAPGAGRGTGSFLQPAATGARGQGGEDEEHQNRYWQKDSELFEDNRLVAPPVIGEDPQQ